MHLVIFANGEFSPEIYNDYDNSYIICCDGGLKFCDRAGVTPDLILGDFDSVDNALLEKYRKLGVEIKTFDCKKDKTDLELALEYIDVLKPDYIDILGAAGTRLDHSLCNIYLLSILLEKGLKATIYSNHAIIKLCNSKEMINGKIGETVSLLPLTQIVKGVTTNGLEYALDNFDLPQNSSRGISNVVCVENAFVEVKEGVLIIIRAWD